MKYWKTARLARYSLLYLVAASPILAITETQRIERLEMLADIWGKLYLFHPSIVTSQVDWSRVLIETIPKVEKAADTDELVAVLNDSLLRPLDDTFTRAQKRETVAAGPVRKVTARQLSGNMGYLDLTDPRDYGSNAASRVGEVVRGLGPVKTLIVEL